MIQNEKQDFSVSGYLAWINVNDSFIPPEYHHLSPMNNVQKQRVKRPRIWNDLICCVIRKKVNSKVTHQNKKKYNVKWMMDQAAGSECNTFVFLARRKKDDDDSYSG